MFILSFNSVASNNEAYAALIQFLNWSVSDREWRHWNDKNLHFVGGSHHNDSRGSWVRILGDLTDLDLERLVHSFCLRLSSAQATQKRLIRVLSPLKKGKYQYGWPPCPLLLGFGCFENEKKFLAFLMQPIPNSMYEEVSRTDTYPLRIKMSIPWVNLLCLRMKSPIQF